MCVVVKGSNSVVSVGIVERIREKNSNTHRFSFYTVDCICSKKEKHWEFILTAGVATYTADCTCKTIGMFPKTYPPSFTHTHTHTHRYTDAVLSEVLQALQVIVLFRLGGWCQFWFACVSV